jgi:hypothetical protein
VAEADAVTKLTGLMKQRRRWLNGTFFAMLYALGNMGRIWTESSHSVARKLLLTFEFIYLLVNLIVGTWCASAALPGWLPPSARAAAEREPTWAVCLTSGSGCSVPGLSCNRLPVLPLRPAAAAQVWHRHLLRAAHHAAQGGV